MATEKEKMLSGAAYNAGDPKLVQERMKARKLLHDFNASDPALLALRSRIVASLFGKVGEGAWIEPPFFCDYGTNIRIGARFYANFNCVILDPASVEIGDDVLLGPAVQIYTAEHPLDAKVRTSGLESARPVKIGSRVWLGGGSIVLPGVTIGDDCVIGAGSVVTKDIPSGMLAAGNPCRVIRKAE